MKLFSSLLFFLISTGSLQSQSGTLDVERGTSDGGTALFRGTLYASHFNYSTSEDTYIRGGKSFSHVIINDLFPLGNVGIGTSSPLYKLHVGAAGAGIVQSDGTYSLGTYTGQGGGWLGTYSNHPLYFFTNNGGKQLSLLQNGYFGIGTTSPATRLHVAQDNEALRLSGINSYLSFYDNNNNAKSYVANNNGNIIMGTFGTAGEVSLRIDGQLGLVVQNDGRVRVGDLGCNIPVNVQGYFGTQYPKLSVHGPFGLKKSWGDQIGEWTLYYSGTNIGLDSEFDLLTFNFNGGFKASIDDVDGDYFSVSDRRLKENFEKYKAVLPELKKLEVLTYHYKSDKKGQRSFGLVAQNLHEHFPELVLGNDAITDSPMAIAYPKTGVLAIKAIQEQQVIIEQLQRKIEEQQVNFETQQRKMEELERRLVRLEGSSYAEKKI